MQLVKEEGKRLFLRIDHLEDLWVLSQYLDTGDLCFGKTERKVKVGSEQNPKHVTKIIFIELLVKKIFFEHETLRVSGEILNETEFTSIGDNHTLSFGIGDIVELEKKRLLKHQDKLLQKALHSSLGKHLLVLLDKDTLLVAQCSEFSYTFLFEHKGLGSKKYTGEEIDENEEKYKLLSELLKREFSSLIFAGPGPWKESLAQYVSSKLGKKVLTFSWQDLEVQSLQKLITEIQKQGLIENSQLSLENEAIQKLLFAIEKNEKAAYGREEVSTMIEGGRVDLLLLTTKYIEEERGEGRGHELNELMNTVENFSGSLLILRSDFEAGIILDGLGGIGSILRY